METPIVNEDGKLEQEQDKSKAQVQDNTPAKSDEHMIPKSRLDAEIGKRKDLEGILSNMVAEMVDDVPEGMRDIIPDLPPAQKISWLRNAHKRGLFNLQPSNGPDSKRPTGKAPVDLNTMNDFQLRVSGYKTS